MAMNTGTVDSYLRDGCGRCEHYQTPECKVHLWAKVLPMLRELVLAAGLDEQLKWGSPTYSLDGKNVLQVVSFKEYAAISFFKGALLEDDELESPGPNSHHVRFLKFRVPADVTSRKAKIKKLLTAALALEKAGVKVEKKERAAVPEELQAVIDGSGAVKKAWEALTPGRQRSHILHVSGAKQAETRVRRAEACAEHIKQGRGFNERD